MHANIWKSWQDCYVEVVYSSYLVGVWGGAPGANHFWALHTQFCAISYTLLCIEVLMHANIWKSWQDCYVEVVYSSYLVGVWGGASGANHFWALHTQFCAISYTF